MANSRTRRIAEAREILAAFGLPAEQRNERAALTLLALLHLGPDKAWVADAPDHMIHFNGERFLGPF